MSAAAYKEFDWSTEGAANGESGIGLARYFIELVSKLESADRICDLGCGNGYMTGRLAELGYELVGVDASDSGLEIARRNYPKAKFIQSLIDDNLCNNLDLGEFDLVVSSDVIEHLYCPSDLLEAARGLLKPNGQLLIGTPYHGYVKNLVLSVTGKMDSHFCVLDNGGHIKFFSVKTLSELLTNHGFVDLKFSYYGRAPWLWKNMICLARKSN
jgi:2-polyprenyl-3-methyl-5-hydroxy-6-metoxy-1,4-benzoquinol methylase